jgi:hypothetical protein
MNDLRDYVELCQEYATKGRDFTRQAEMENMQDMLVANINEELLSLILEGKIPNTIKSFSELHDYVDANMLGDWEGTFDDVDSEAFKVFGDELNQAQCRVDALLRHP